MDSYVIFDLNEIVPNITYKNFILFYFYFIQFEMKGHQIISFQQRKIVNGVFYEFE